MRNAANEALDFLLHLFFYLFFSGVYFFFSCGVACVLVLLFHPSRTPAKPMDPKIDQARGMCRTWADRLDGRTTDVGAYIRPGTSNEDYLEAFDPWGRQIKVMYSRGGVAESLKVVSFGPDGIQGTKDDIEERRCSTNYVGIGNGIKKNAEETSANAARGTAKGLIQGVKEELFASKKKESSASTE
ncbi:MAG: hypothetical protein N2C14_06850 [Planctomycetales bacterium]